MKKIWLFLLAVFVVFVLEQERFSIVAFWGQLPDFNSEKILAGQKRESEFKARANGLGTIKINLDVYSQEVGGNDTYDSLIFRIKEKGADSWYYQNRYDNIIH